MEPAQNYQNMYSNESIEIEFSTDFRVILDSFPSGFLDVQEGLEPLLDECKGQEDVFLQW